jgi:hypothetical protein
LRGVVKHCVDTRPLLEEHGDARHDNALEHGFCLEQCAYCDKLQFESVPCSLLGEVRKGFCETAFLEQGLCFDFKEFQLDELVVLREIAQGCEILSSFFFAVVVPV